MIYVALSFAFFIFNSIKKPGAIIGCNLRGFVVARLWRKGLVHCSGDLSWVHCSGVHLTIVGQLFPIVYLLFFVVEKLSKKSKKCLKTLKMLGQMI